jgi:hypothetical protein
MRLLVQVPPELRRIDEVAVVSEGDTVRRVDVERLRLGVRAAASSRVSEVTKTHGTGKVAHALAVVEHLGCESIALALHDLAAAGAGGDTASILSTVLEVVQGLLVSVDGCRQYI